MGETQKSGKISFVLLVWSTVHHFSKQKQSNWFEAIKSAVHVLHFRREKCKIKGGGEEIKTGKKRGSFKR